MIHKTVKITNLKINIRYNWPVHFVLLFTNWFPDNVSCYAFRGWLIRKLLAKCGNRLLVGRNVTIQNPSNLFLGSNVYLGYDTFFQGSDEIVIGDRVLVAPNCLFVSDDHVRVEGSYSNDTKKSSPILIQNDCWLGAHVVVTAGSKIGSGVCVAAGAVVHGDFPDNVMIGGVPARIIKKLE